MKQTGLKKNLSSRSDLRSCRWISSLPADNNDDYHRSCDRHDDNSADNDQLCGQYRDLYAGFGLLYIPNSGKCGTRPLLLHEGHDRRRPGRSGCKFVGHSSRPAGDHLLFNCGRPGRGAESCADPACHDYQARGNDHHHNDKAVTEMTKHE